MTVNTESSGWLGKILLLLLLLVLVSGGLLFHYMKSVRSRSETPPKSSTAPRSTAVPQSTAVSKSKEDADLDAKLNETRARLAESQTKAKAEIKRFNSVKHGAAGADYLEEIQRRTVKFFREAGLLPGDGNMAAVLINYQVMGKKEILSLIMTSNRTPRLVPTAGVHPRRSPHSGVTKTEQQLYFLFSVAYQDFDLQEVKASQTFWRNYGGTTPAGLQQRMLESDRIMQALALDAIIRAKANAILKNGSFQPGDKSQLGVLFELLQGLLHPEKGKPSFLQWFAE